MSATALAPTAAEAEALAKAALLGGPLAGRALLARHGGGVLVLEDGTAAVVGRGAAARAGGRSGAARAGATARGEAVA